MYRIVRRKDLNKTVTQMEVEAPPDPKTVSFSPARLMPWFSRVFIKPYPSVE